MSQDIFALGGLTKDNIPATEVKMFNKTSQRWDKVANEKMKKLMSTDTDELLVLPYPTSSLDCVPEDCKCGVPNNNRRIIDGTETKVIFILNLKDEFCKLSISHLTAESHELAD